MPPTANGSMERAPPTNAELAAMRRPKAGNPFVARARAYQATNILVIFLALVVVVVAWSLIAPDQLRFATEGNLAILSQQISGHSHRRDRRRHADDLGRVRHLDRRHLHPRPVHRRDRLRDARLGAAAGPPRRPCSSPSRSVSSTASSPSASASPPSSPRSGRCSCCAASSGSSRSIRRRTSPTASPSFLPRRSRRRCRAISSARSIHR